MKHSYYLFLLIASFLLLSNSCMQNLSSVITEGNSANGQIKDLIDPNDQQDAATKAYVDALLKRIEDLEAVITPVDPNFINTLKQGDKVLTIGGIHGKVVEVAEYDIIVEVGKNTLLEVNKYALRAPRTVGDY